MVQYSCVTERGNYPDMSRHVHITFCLRYHLVKMYVARVQSTCSLLASHMEHLWGVSIEIPIFDPFGGPTSRLAPP